MSATYATLPASSPHSVGGSSVSRIMLTVCVALMPATLYGFGLYGWPAIFLWVVTVAATLIGEAACLRLMERRAVPVLADGSVLLTGWLLALSLPPWAPWWIGLLGGLFASVLAKQVFGGLGQNLFNPAMAARVFLLVSFPVAMTAWVAPAPLTAAGSPGFLAGLRITFELAQTPDAMASASLLGHAKTELSRGIDLLHSLTGAQAPGVSFAGSRAGSLGETSGLLLGLGGLMLLALRVISWHIPVAMLAGLALPAAIAHAAEPTRYLDAATHLLSGSAILGAFFIATDYVTSPNTRRGQLMFGFGCGFLTYVIRTWGGYPEGVAFAVLFMNALTPVIDRYVRPRILGRDRHGRPLDPAKERSKS